MKLLFSLEGDFNLALELFNIAILRYRVCDVFYLTYLPRILFSKFERALAFQGVEALSFRLAGEMYVDFDLLQIIVIWWMRMNKQ